MVQVLTQWDKGESLFLQASCPRSGNFPILFSKRSPLLFAMKESNGGADTRISRPKHLSCQNPILKRSCRKSIYASSKGTFHWVKSNVPRVRQLLQNVCQQGGFKPRIVRKQTERQVRSLWLGLALVSPWSASRSKSFRLDRLFSKIWWRRDL